MDKGYLALEPLTHDELSHIYYEYNFEITHIEMVYHVMCIQGKAAHIRSKQHLNSKVSALSAEPNPVPTIREEGSSCKTSEDGLDREQEVEEAEEAEEDPVGVELITSDHIRSAVIMGNLIEGRDMDEGTECMTGGGIFSGVSLAMNNRALLSFFCQTA